MVCLPRPLLNTIKGIKSGIMVGVLSLRKSNPAGDPKQKAVRAKRYALKCAQRSDSSSK